MYPKPMITQKLTEFVTECEDDHALTLFLSAVYEAKLAHSTKDRMGNKLVFVLFMNKTSKVYAPLELIEEILEDDDRIAQIPEVVHHIKDHIDYKKRVNYFEE